MKLAARLMQANAQTALALHKLKMPAMRPAAAAHTPKAGNTPEIQKTNGAA
jgi:hypothetical protein